jgi:uncharacterized membrane protein
MMYGYNIGPKDWLFMLAMMTVMTIVTAVAVVAIVRAVRRGSRESSASNILGERYGRGEIASEEYQERKRQLDQK